MSLTAFISPAAITSAANNLPTGQITLVGSALQGALLVATSTVADADGLGAFSYRWETSFDGNQWRDIEGAHSSLLTLGQGQVGLRVRALVSYTDGAGYQESVASSATSLVVNVNDAPTGSLKLINPAHLGSPISVTHDLQDADGLGSMRYQWQSSADGLTWANIQNAISVTFLPTEAQVGLRLRATAAYTDDYGFPEAVVSAASEPVATGNIGPIGAIAIFGSARQGETLTAQNSLFDANGMGPVRYQWQSSLDGSTWGDLVGAVKDTLALPQAMVGLQLRAIGSYVDGLGKSESLASASTATVQNVNDAPIGQVLIAGTAKQGQTLSLNASLADADGLGVFQHRWQASSDGQVWTELVGETVTKLVLTQAHVGLRLRAVVTYVDGQQTTEVVLSDPTPAVLNVNDPVTGWVTIGGTPTKGQTLTATAQLEDIDGLGASTLQWQRFTGFQGWEDIGGGVGSEYTPTLLDLGRSLRVVASFVDGQGTQESLTSATSAPVLDGNTLPEGAVTVSQAPHVGKPTVAVVGLTDADGLGSFSYAWQSSTDGTTWMDLAGATADELIPGDSLAGQNLRVLVRYVDGRGTAELVTSAASDPTIGVIRGTAGPDHLVGSALADELLGLDGNDRLQGGGGNDLISGGAGIDTAIYLGPRSDYRVGAGGRSVEAVAATEGLDALTDIERIQFLDQSLAFDLDGQAGVVARILGAVFGAAEVTNLRYAGIGLELLGADSSRDALMKLALDARLGTGFTPADEIQLLFLNVLGRSAEQADLDYWSGSLASGQFTPVSLAWLAADLELNAVNIGLIGLVDEGLGYV